MTDFREMVRRFRLKCSNRSIARELGVSRNTVAQYKALAVKKGWLDPETAIPPFSELQEAMEALRRPRNTGPGSTVEPYRKLVEQLVQQGVDIQPIWQILRKDYGYQGSYSAVRRFVRKLAPRSPATCIRVETKPGEEAQVDFGYVGKLLDPLTRRERKAWVFVMTLSWSRHMYAEIVFDQKVETWLALHIRAFEFFGGVPKRVVIDNLKAAITKACFHDPVVQQSYRGLAEHYGFLISPCRIATPEHKGKVESGVKYVKRNALAGRTFRDLGEANAHLRRWLVDTAGVRVHGTTHEKPLDRFEGVEKAVFMALPPDRYEAATWKEVKLHPDCHVVFDYAYYSAPHRFVGLHLMVKSTAHKVEIYHRYEHVATHARAKARGQRITNNDHLPPDKVQGMMPAPRRLKERAEAIGPFTAQVVRQLLGDRPVDRLRSAMGIVGLAKRYDGTRLELACRRALLFDDIRYGTIKNILKKGLEADPLPEEEFAANPLPKTSRYARTPGEFLAHSS